MPEIALILSKNSSHKVDRSHMLGSDAESLAELRIKPPKSKTVELL
jgi:hypothetical protein